VTADSPASGLPQEAVDLDLVRKTAEAHLNAPRYYADRLLDVLDLLAAERAKVAGLRETIDKVREYVTTHGAVGPSSGVRFHDATSILALLPAVSEGAPTVGTDVHPSPFGYRCCGAYPAHAAGCPVVPAAVVQPTGTVGECGHAEHRDMRSLGQETASDARQGGAPCRL
jgi:hypothetical protein